MPLAVKRTRAVLACILALFCLSPAAMAAPWMDAGDNSGIDSKPLLLTSPLSGGTASALATRARSRLTDGLNDLLKTAIVSGRTLIFVARNSLPRFLEDNPAAAGRTECTVVSVRAPPLQFFIQS
jgi:hypothetical protein